MKHELATSDQPRPIKPRCPGSFRRVVVAMSVLYVVCVLTKVPALASGAEPDGPMPDSIRQENMKPGATDWQLTRVRPDRDGFRSAAIEGYCSRQSVPAGESIDLNVSTDPPRPFQIELFRMGYYGGRGARLMASLGPFQGRAQAVPSPAAKNLHECRWTPAVRLDIPRDWPSGVYLGRLTTRVDPAVEPYWQSYLIFIVRDDRPADILFQCSDNTWQAYNRWPSKYSIYTHPRGTQGPWADVSFDRPYAREAQYDAVVNDPLTFGSGEFLPLEFPLAYWLEQRGYDVTYASNSDLISPDRGLKCKAFLSVGHDEYWDIRQFRSVQQMRDAGVNLLFFSGNAICWVTPHRPSHDGRPDRIMFRGGPVRRRQRLRPRQGEGAWSLPGARAGRGAAHGGAQRRAGQWRRRLGGPRSPTTGPSRAPASSEAIASPAWSAGNTTATRRRSRAFRSLPAARPGWEARRPRTGPRRSIPGPRANFVFNASTIFWAQALSSPPGHTLPWSHGSRPHGPDERVQKITQNLLERAIRPQRSAE